MRLPLAVMALCAALFAFAFVAAPYSCEWGLDAYFWAGVGVVLALGVLPFAARGSLTGGRRVQLASLHVALGVAVWLAGLFLANVRIMCRLF